MSSDSTTSPPREFPARVINCDISSSETHKSATIREIPPQRLAAPGEVEASQRLNALVCGIGNAISSSPHRSQPMGTYSIPQKRRLEVYERDGWKCVYCGAQLAKPEEWLPCSSGIPGMLVCPWWLEPATVDHVLPQSRGGNHKVENLVACCHSCNASKSTKTADEWLNTPSWHKRQAAAKLKAARVGR